MIIDILYSRLESYASLGYTAISTTHEKSTYGQLLKLISQFRGELAHKYQKSKTIIIRGNYGINSIAMFWAALLEKRIVFPITQTTVSFHDIITLSNADIVFKANKSEYANITHIDKLNEGISALIRNEHPGIILLSSGTTGNPKAILHDAEKLLKKYLSSQKRYSTMATMLFDHIAGVDTMFYTLASGGSIVVPEDRNPDGIINMAINEQVEVLPSSPSLIQLMLLDTRFSPESLPSLKIITFGSEYMTEYVKRKLVERFSGKVSIIQKYGITEIGNPATITKEDDPSFIKFKSDLIEYRISDGILMIKSDSSMMGYLHLDRFESFDGWFNTQDKVEVDGDWLKILGRVTDIINVGGQKVYPAEVESVLQGMDNVKDVLVYGKENPFLGSVVAVKVSLHSSEDLSAFKSRMRIFCKNKLDSYKIPAIVDIVDSLNVSNRFKKVR